MTDAHQAAEIDSFHLLIEGLKLNGIETIFQTGIGKCILVFFAVNNAVQVSDFYSADIAVVGPFITETILRLCTANDDAVIS